MAPIQEALWVRRFSERLNWTFLPRATDENVHRAYDPQELNLWCVWDAVVQDVLSRYPGFATSCVQQVVYRRRVGLDRCSFWSLAKFGSGRWQVPQKSVFTIPGALAHIWWGGGVPDARVGLPALDLFFGEGSMVVGKRIVWSRICLEGWGAGSL